VGILLVGPHKVIHKVIHNWTGHNDREITMIGALSISVQNFIWPWLEHAQRYLNKILRFCRAEGSAKRHNKTGSRSRPQIWG